MQYRAIVLDLDGTLTNDAKEITPRTYQALIAAQQKGVKVVLASGRPLQGILFLADILHLSEYDGYILAFNGGLIYRCRDQQIISKQELSAEFVPELYKEARQNHFEILSYYNDVIEATTANNTYIQKASYANRMRIVECPEFVHQIHFPIYKCLIVGDPERMPSFEKKLAAKMAGQLDIYCSTEFFLECVPLGIDKANALRHLFNEINIPIKEVIAFGDGHNDISMIALAGLGVAMANADPTVKASADFVTDTNNNDGVAKVIEQNILQTHKKNEF